MTRARVLAVSLALFLFAAGNAEASWYDDYDAGLVAARAGNWAVVAQRMTAAIKGNATENNRARTYGMDFRNYHPYYYRGVANLNLGKYEQAIADLEKTSGPGPENLGDIASLLDRAKKQLAASNEPAPEPVRPAPEQTRPAPTIPAPIQQPAAPTIDPALRGRAASALNAAKGKIQAAQNRKATTSPQYTQAMSMFGEATTRNASARTNEDLNAIIDIAENAGSLAELAMPPAAVASAPVPATIVPSPGAITPKPAAATSAVLEDYSRDLRRALENYFAGEFEAATRDFERLSRQMPSNGWIWAFLGASQYSVYAFEADDDYRAAALKSFGKAKQLKRWTGGLPEKYFSKRIRNAFAKTEG